MEKLEVATMYHDIVYIMDTHMKMEVGVMVKNILTEFSYKDIILSQTRGIMVLFMKMCPCKLICHRRVRENQELERGCKSFGLK